MIFVVAEQAFWIRREDVFEKAVLAGWIEDELAGQDRIVLVQEHRAEKIVRQKTF